MAMTVSAFCQTYPVSISARIAKPYSIYLSDYVQTGTERLSTTLLLRDASEAMMFAYTSPSKGLAYHWKASPILP